MRKKATGSDTSNLKRHAIAKMQRCLGHDVCSRFHDRLLPDAAQQLLGRYRFTAVDANRAQAYTRSPFWEFSLPFLYPQFTFQTLPRIYPGRHSRSSLVLAGSPINDASKPISHSRLVMVEGINHEQRCGVGRGSGSPGEYIWPQLESVVRRCARCGRTGGCASPNVILVSTCVLGCCIKIGF